MNAPFLTIDRGQGALVVRSEREAVALFGPDVGAAAWELALERHLLEPRRPPTSRRPRRGSGLVLDAFAFPRSCTWCCRSFNAAEWVELPYNEHRHGRDVHGGYYEVRWCKCGGELAVEVEP